MNLRRDKGRSLARPCNSLDVFEDKVEVPAEVEAKFL